MSPVPRVIAVGGGGFTHAVDPALEDFILSCCGVPRPRVGFIGTASGDDPVKIRRFHERFAAVASACICLPAGAGATQARDFLDGVDLVYVGGGHTLRLVAHWRSSGLDALLGAALQRGVLMAGVSAGASAWFERFLTDSAGQGLQTASGIGLMPGSCCPHYSTEPLRPPAFTAAIGQGDLPAGLAIDDGAAVLLGPQDSPTVFSARPGARAYRVERDGDGVRSVALPSAR